MEKDSEEGHDPQRLSSRVCEEEISVWREEFVLGNPDKQGYARW